MPSFKFINNNQDFTFILLPGWATDYRIFSPLFDYCKDFNYFFPRSGLAIKKLFQEFSKAVEQFSINKFNVFGASLGGFLAAELFREISPKPERLILAGVKKKYPLAGLEKVENYLKRNKQAYLYKFYQRCFFSPQLWQWFKKNLLKDYLDKFSLSFLLEGISYFKHAEITLQKNSKVSLVWGNNDRIVSFPERDQLSKEMFWAHTDIVKGCGHFPFLSSEFSLKDYV